MNWLDAVIVGVLVLSVAFSLWRGFVREVISLAAWVLAFWIAVRYTPKLEPLIGPYVPESVGAGAAFVTLFVATLLVAAIVNALVGRLVKSTGLSGFDRALGAVFGLARGLVVVALLALVAGFTHMPQSDGWQESLLMQRIQQWALWGRDRLPPDIAAAIHY